MDAREPMLTAVAPCGLDSEVAVDRSRKHVEVQDRAVRVASSSQPMSHA